MPSHLTSDQRNLIYKQRNHKSLITDPVIATLDGEEFTLRPINRRQDLPNLRKSLYAAAELMKTKGDWDNLPRLLEGLRHGGLKTTPNALTILSRKAGSAGRQDVLLECARQVEATGYRLYDSEVVRQTLWWFQAMAVDSKFEAEATKKALAWSEQIFEMMELPQHVGKGVKEGELDPRVQPQSVAILLELAAARASKHLDGKDVDGKVAKYAERLSQTSLDFGTPAEMANQSHWISTSLPALYGMKTALKILDPASEASQKLQVASGALEEKIDGYRKDLPKSARTGKPPRSVELYKMMFEES